MSAPKPAAAPQRVVLEGRYVRLEPLTMAHAPDLFEASNVVDGDERFAYLGDYAPKAQADTEAFIRSVEGKADPMLFAVIDKSTGKAGGRQALMRIVPEHGVIEIGSIYWGPAIARTPRATEALYLFARHIFDELGYRRFEWKCNDRNEPSKRAARRFGFSYEGLFRQHMIMKGENRDTAWFSMLDSEWPARKAEFERWLAPGNFDADGRQRTPLNAA
ncbi:GNAT family N-acetyltransferase [Devosia sp. A16]|uniref:GNAT family N-acetyltransferase n=1 Tax=Devosia sp. A16 TaxID=1736675 RepID=UPI0006D8305B|nr:GNAT family protein [Devosia sp. A16]